MLRMLICSLALRVRMLVVVRLGEIVLSHFRGGNARTQLQRLGERQNNGSHNYNIISCKLDRLTRSIQATLFSYYIFPLLILHYRFVLFFAFVYNSNSVIAADKTLSKHDDDDHGHTKKTARFLSKLRGYSTATICNHHEKKHSRKYKYM